MVSLKRDEKNLMLLIVQGQIAYHCFVSANERDKNDVYCNKKGTAVPYTTDFNSFRSCTGEISC